MSDKSDVIRSDLSQVIEQLIKYIVDKYQIPDFSAYILCDLLLRAYEVKFGYKPIDLSIYVKSINAPARVDPLWLRALRELTKINTNTTLVNELMMYGKRKLKSVE